MEIIQHQQQQPQQKNKRKKKSSKSTSSSSLQNNSLNNMSQQHELDGSQFDEFQSNGDFEQLPMSLQYSTSNSNNNSLISASVTTTSTTTTTTNNHVNNNQQPQQQQLDDIYSDEYCENQMKCMEGYIKKWSEDYLKSVSEDIEHHSKEFKKYTAQLEIMKSERAFLQSFKENNLQVLQLQKLQLQRAENEIKSFEKNRDQLPVDLESTKLKYTEETTRFKQLEQQVEQIERISNKSLNELEQPLQQFKQLLGLEFQRHTSGDGLKFIFTKIDRNDHNREFTISLSTDPNTDNYTIINCVPMVSNLDQLLRQLNDTNNLSTFIKSIRKQFVNKVLK